MVEPARRELGPLGAVDADEPRGERRQYVHVFEMQLSASVAGAQQSRSVLHGAPGGLQRHWARVVSSALHEIERTTPPEPLHSPELGLTHGLQVPPFAARHEK
jgi:hypothetical protein